MSVRQPCEACEGAGRSVNDEDCSACNGTGSVRTGLAEVGTDEVLSAFIAWAEQSVSHLLRITHESCFRAGVEWATRERVEAAVAEERREILEWLETVIEQADKDERTAYHAETATRAGAIKMCVQGIADRFRSRAPSANEGDPK